MTGPVDGTAPLLRIVRGDPTAEELAALVSAVAARRAAEAATIATRTAAHPPWRNKSRLLRHLPQPGPGAWRSSGLPH
jgi:Acyl-CoA carboxylase epsilon subunit